MALRHHAVLASVSRRYPPPMDRFLRVTHPSATAVRRRPCDLHVLSMPPAFALSQDQTLRFILLPVTGEQNELILNSILGSPQSHEGQEEENHLENHCVCIAYAKYTHSVPQAANRASQDQSQPTPISHPHRSNPCLSAQAQASGTPPAYPFHSDSPVKEQNRAQQVQPPCQGPNPLNQADD